METSAPKRRRTSPRTSVAVQPENQAQSTPSEQQPSGLKAAAKRPSFASPTKASLERYNPDILRRRPSPPKQSRTDQNPPLSAPRPTSRGSFGGLSRAIAAHAEEPEDTGDGELAARNSIRGGELLGEGESVLRSPARRPGTKRGSDTEPTSHPPPGPSDEEGIHDPFARRGLRRSPPIGEPPEPVPEPELPPTPEHPDPVVSTPPSGIHNTPSRRPRRNKALAEKVKSSSPLKNPPVTSSPGQDEAPPVFKLPARPSKPSKLSKSVQPRDSPVQTTAELRGLQPEDPDSEKKKLRDSLLAQIAELERDLRVASTENERIAQAHLSKSQLQPPGNAQQVLDLLRRHALPPEKEPETDTSTSWLQSALDPVAFLPFSKLTPAQPSLFLPPDEGDKSELPISHHPLPMTSEEALPFLQVFTPLTFTSRITTHPNPDSPAPSLLQRHSISATSTAPRGLFTARVEMTVDTRTMAVVDLSVPRLEPAATAELTPFIERVVSKQPPLSSAINNNVNVLMWGMGEWLRVATQRARVWGVLEQELAGEKEALVEMVERMRERRQKQKRRRRRVRGVERDESEEAEEQDAADGKKFDAVELLPWMGRTSMDFEIPLLQGGGGADVMSTLRVQWRIGFDWTGEAKSEISVLVGVPGKWHKCDERGRLSGIPGLFDELIKGGETPLVAVRTVASLLAGEQRS
ncbi:hypothetical protein QBC34DRAFT_404562 [Podospora aff. communis PSN243]|uniref:Uncharacterized protein n=1 Tax=Podospora aff. communis PSN243 TaxID=3040156 RepID=A0AAV9GSL9_9PEZI|nr:hypothetical protein QBC34DRAFT_404562 [Podospora aff. communis PSN243]